MPRLLFQERNCVQCGMCEKACPESVIELEARFNFDSQDRNKAKVINEEEPFSCIKCGIPFSTRTMMDRIRDKLAGHWMYQDQAQMRRLEMCENCRVEDLYTNDSGFEPGRKPQ